MSTVGCILCKLIWICIPNRIVLMAFKDLGLSRLRWLSLSFCGLGWWWPGWMAEYVLLDVLLCCFKGMMGFASGLSWLMVGRLPVCRALYVCVRFAWGASVGSVLPLMCSSSAELDRLDWSLCCSSGVEWVCGVGWFYLLEARGFYWFLWSC